MILNGLCILYFKKCQTAYKNFSYFHFIIQNYFIFLDIVRIFKK